MELRDSDNEVNNLILSNPCVVMQQYSYSCISQGIFESWRSPWGKGSNVSSSRHYGSTWTCISSITGASPHWPWKTDQSWERGQHLAFAATADTDTFPAVLLSPPSPAHSALALHVVSTLPCSTASLILSKPLHRHPALVGLWGSSSTRSLSGLPASGAAAHDGGGCFAVTKKQPLLARH